MIWAPLHQLSARRFDWVASTEPHRGTYSLHAWLLGLFWSRCNGCCHVAKIVQDSSCCQHGMMISLDGYLVMTSKLCVGICANPENMCSGAAFASIAWKPRRIFVWGGGRRKVGGEKRVIHTQVPPKASNSSLEFWSAVCDSVPTTC